MIEFVRGPASKIVATIRSCLTGSGICLPSSCCSRAVRDKFELEMSPKAQRESPQKELNKTKSLLERLASISPEAGASGRSCL